MRKPSRATIDSTLDKLLAERRKSDSSYAPVTDEDWKLLHRLINDILHAKFESDADGDLPVEYDLVNRHTHQRNQYLPVEYASENKTTQEILDIVRRLAYNVEAAARGMDLMASNLAYYLDCAKDTLETG